jgi:FtsZ-binding cell division protein ZapB
MDIFQITVISAEVEPFKNQKCKLGTEGEKARQAPPLIQHKAGKTGSETCVNQARLKTQIGRSCGRNQD